MEVPLVPEVLLQHGQFVRALAHGLLRDSHAAEDVAQETWARYFAHPPMEQRGLRPWLRTVARNLAANLGRAESRRVLREEQVARAETLPAAESELEQGELLQAVVEAVLTLDEPYRATILARYWRGFDAAEVAAAMGASAATVRSREQRALEKLREHLDRRFRGERAGWAAVLARIAGRSKGLERGPLVGRSSSGAKLAAVLGIAVVLVVALRWAVSSAGSKESSATDTRASARSHVPPTERDSLAPRSTSAVAPSAREAVESTSGGSAASEAFTAPPSYVLKGILKHSSDGRPAPGVRLNLHNDSPPNDFTEVLTDSEGRFTTDALRPGILRPWVLSDLGPITVQQNIRPTRFSVPFDQPDLELFLVDPEAWLDLRIVTHGAPCANAELAWGFEEDEREWLYRWQTRADELGHIRVGFPSLGPEKRLHLVAFGGDGLISEPVAVSERPPDAPIVLEVEPGARILVRARDSSGVPVAGQDVVLTCKLHPLLRQLLPGARTDETGVARLLVPAGDYVVGIGNSALQRSAQQEIEVEAGSETSVDLRLDDLLPVAVSGRVVDEQGGPIPHAVLVVHHENMSETFLAEEDGRFTYRLAGTGVIHLETNLSLLGDRFEPSELDVPVGTTGVLIRRVEIRRLTTVDLEVVTGSSSEHVLDVHPKLFRPPQAFDELNTMSEGLASVELPAGDEIDDDIDLVLDARGYRRRIIKVMDLLRETGIQRIALEPGFDLGLVIQDGEGDHAPLAGALVYEGDVVLGSAGADGRVAFDLDHWPSEVRVTSPGYESSTWTASDWLESEDAGYVWLEPLQPSQK